MVKKPKIHKGPRGGKYRVVNGKKRYLSKQIKAKSKKAVVAKQKIATKQVKAPRSTSHLSYIVRLQRWRPAKEDEMKDENSPGTINVVDKKSKPFKSPDLDKILIAAGAGEDMEKLYAEYRRNENVEEVWKRYDAAADKIDKARFNDKIIGNFEKILRSKFPKLVPKGVGISMISRREKLVPAEALKPDGSMLWKYSNRVEIVFSKILEDMLAQPMW